MGINASESTPDSPIRQAAALAWMAFFDILVFFGVLLVGFAYLWRRGDLAWVRSVGDRRRSPPPPSGAAAAAKATEQVLTPAGSPD